MLEIAETKPATEYIDGVAYQKVSPKWQHGRVQLALANILERYSGGAGQAVTELRIHLSGDTTLVPDVAYVSDARLHAVSQEALEEPRFPPDIVVEVRSPSDRPSLIERKVSRYLEHGISLVIDADPDTRTIKAYTKGGERVYRAGQPFQSEAFPWLDFEVGEAFAGIDLPKS